PRPPKPRRPASPSPQSAALFSAPIPPAGTTAMSGNPADPTTKDVNTRVSFNKGSYVLHASPSLFTDRFRLCRMSLRVGLLSYASRHSSRPVIVVYHCDTYNNH